MKHLVAMVIILTLVFAAITCPTSQAAGIDKSRPSKSGYGVPLKARAEAYAMPLEHIASPPSGSVTRIPLAPTFTAGSMISPGLEVGYTYYDMQHVGSMGRMIETGPHSDQMGTMPTIVHNGWMYLADADEWSHRSYAYAAYNSDDHSQVGPVIMHEPPTSGGYVNVDATPDNRALVGGHFRVHPDSLYRSEIFFDGGAAYATFPNSIRVPDSLAAYGQTTGFEAIWPKFFFQFGTDTVMHVVTQIYELGATPRALMYFRKAGFEGSTDKQWTYPPYVVDTVETIGHDLIGQRNGDRVSLVWTASLPYNEPACDTCSGVHDFVYEGMLISQRDNDIYYQESFDQGVTFEPRVNVTKIPIGAEAYKAYTDLSGLYDSYGNLHIIWPACWWPEDLCIETGGGCFTEDWYVDNARLMHWSENIPYIRPIVDQTYEVGYEPYDSCWAGQWNLRIAKPSLSECNGNLYAIWTQFNDPKAGIIDDCAKWGYWGIGEGAANGEIYVSASEDGGMTWEWGAHNLTNSYTPRCDPIHAEPCQNDHWASMTRFGREKDPAEDWTQAIVVLPTGAPTNDYYLDIQYVNDLDAGAAIMDEGSWTNSLIKWFRMPCYDPVHYQCIWVYPYKYGPPAYARPGSSLDTTLTIENIGNVTVNYTITPIEDNGPPGWLAVSGFSGSIPSGLGGVEIGNVHLNYGGIITTPGIYYGRLRIDCNCPYGPCPLDVEVELWVTEDIGVPHWETVNTDCLALTVSNHGNMGHKGVGKVNMDYYDDGDCDTTAKIYMYSGSPLVGGIFDGDTVFQSSIFYENPYGDNGLYPSREYQHAVVCQNFNGDVFQSGDFTARAYPLSIRKVWVAPQDDCEFIIQYMRVQSGDGAAHEDIMLGEAIDWDVPWDYRLDDPDRNVVAVNSSGIDGPRHLLYQQGYEAYGLGSDTLYPFNCQYNDARFAGLAFVESYLNGTSHLTYPYGGFIGENDSLLDGNPFDNGLLWRKMVQPGLWDIDSVEDLTSVMCFESSLDLQPDDVYEVVTVMATVREGTLADLQAAVDAGVAWYNDRGGMTGLFAVGDDGWIVCDCCAEMGKFYNDGYPYSILDIDNFVEWLLRNPGVPEGPYCLEQLDICGGDDCVWSGLECIYPDGQIDILDLDCWINCLLRLGGPCPSECP